MVNAFSIMEKSFNQEVLQSRRLEPMNQLIETLGYNLWKKLNELFESKNSLNKAFLIRKLVNLKYKDGSSVRAVFVRYKLQSFSPPNNASHDHTPLHE
ncbi:unnamed protein product [Sphenostylis stenocarpa]|uniref:Uncharacterized protein n=1 Tax=Sphenostylis stenocarpa TaxID=92480 RepID=A0AA86SDC2_9FABA|nr:unnamed protein product [Sphenostylis stenocarpa]